MPADQRIDEGTAASDRSPRLRIIQGHDPFDLETSLRHTIDGEVRFDRTSRALYATDASNYRQVPLGVVIPRHSQDVVQTLKICRAFEVPVVSRGGGTSLAGQSCNVAVVLDFSKYMNQIVALDARQAWAIVQPGVILDSLRGAAERHHLTFGPDPATHSQCTLGGMIGNNSCGVHSLMAGCTASNVLAMDIVLYDGTQMHIGDLAPPALAAQAQNTPQQRVYAALSTFLQRHSAAIRSGFPDIPRRVSGYNLPALLPENGANLARALVGSEGTLVTLLQAKVRLVPSPPYRQLVILGYESVYEAADHIEEVLESKPIGLEGLDKILLDASRKKGLDQAWSSSLPPGEGWLFVEFGAQSKDEARAKAKELESRLQRLPSPPSILVVASEQEAKGAWEIRESGLGATARVPGQPDTWPGWEDSSVPLRKLGLYLRDLRALLDRYDYHAAFYGHFGQGCVHTRIPFDLKTSGGVEKYRSFVEHAADLVAQYGGSLSGEHGDGQSRAELLPRMFSPELITILEEFKAIFDPQNKMNPGKVIFPQLLTQNLRLGPDYHRPALRTHFKYPDDQGSLAYATERCVGVGKCRRLDGEVMCPSYRVTREEQHSTRGRAHLLFEMMRGGLDAQWNNQGILESLDLCLSCKACKNECPVNVDIATYKAEFLAHHYKGKLRPRAAYVFGQTYWLARFGSRMPHVVNWAMQAPLLSWALKGMMGMARESDFPKLAHMPFSTWWLTRPVRNAGKPEVLLWVDTFNNYWQPAVLQAAVSVLEDAGRRVTIMRKRLCCGRPLYAFGWLDQAKSQLRETLAALTPIAQANIPIVGLEPSCVAAFRDELVNFFPHDAAAKTLSKSVLMLDEFLHQQSLWQPPRLRRRAIVQAHCHQRSVLTMHGQAAILAAMQTNASLLESGCCGMAGSFGYERQHYDVSVACGERSLLPAVAQAPKDTLVVADGFSCRQQIRHHTKRHALHLAQVLEMANKYGQDGPSQSPPESALAVHEEPVGRIRKVARFLGTVGGVAAVVITARRLRQPRRSLLA